jgi:hypothetical protein
MADSARKQIIDAIVATLTTGSTGIVTVTTKREPWWEWDVWQFPGVCVLEGPEKKSRFSYPDASSSIGDMYSELEVNVLGYAQDMRNDLDMKRTDLIRDIEKAISISTTLNDLTLDIIPQTVETDQGTLENYCITHNRYLVKYIYNHATP